MTSRDTLNHRSAWFRLNDISAHRILTKISFPPSNSFEDLLSLEKRHTFRSTVNQNRLLRQHTKQIISSFVKRNNSLQAASTSWGCTQASMIIKVTLWLFEYGCFNIASRLLCKCLMAGTTHRPFLISWIHFSMYEFFIWSLAYCDWVRMSRCDWTAWLIRYVGCESMWARPQTTSNSCGEKLKESETVYLKPLENRKQQSYEVRSWHWYDPLSCIK